MVYVQSIIHRWRDKKKVRRSGSHWGGGGVYSMLIIICILLCKRRAGSLVRAIMLSCLVFLPLNQNNVQSKVPYFTAFDVTGISSIVVAYAGQFHECFWNAICGSLQCMNKGA